MLFFVSFGGFRICEAPESLSGWVGNVTEIHYPVMALDNRFEC